MKLDRFIIELLKLYEDNSEGRLESYQLIPELLRGEIKTISWNPSLETDHNGQLTRISSSLKVEYYEHENE